MTPEPERLPAPPLTLAADATLADAVELVRAGAPVLLLARAGGGHGEVLDPVVVRAAHVSGEDPATPAARLAAAPPSGVEVELDEQGRAAAVRLEARGGPVRRAIVMAGGRGRRLRPLTDRVPKPLVEVGGQPLLGHVLDLLARHGVEEALVSTRYLAEDVERWLESRGHAPPRVSTLREEEPLGTAGALGLAQGRLHERLFLVNGDVLTDADLTAMAAHHLRSGAAATVATVRYQWRIPYGVVRADGLAVASIEEKPLYRFETNAGLYLFEPSVLRDVPAGRAADMVSLLNGLAERGEVVARFPLVEDWSDVGTPADLERAREEVEDGGGEVA